MRCPRCKTSLEGETADGIAVERCPNCNGRWLDHNELTQLEATVESDEAWRAGMIEWAKAPSNLLCPACGKPMTTFDYRGEGVHLDVCRAQHGYWLDRGEASDVRDAMDERVEDLERANKAEVEWGALMYKMRNPSWLDRLMEFLRG
ncbi:MAG: zf-TFIIB domain-containing protein [Dehalococcoidia bacterium]